jgi:predicted ArsR family transcriptional regulator
VAFPTLPDGAEDLPHILDVPTRTVDRDALAEAAERQLRADAARAVDADDDERIERLLDVSYDLETWGSTDVSGVRSRLDDALENRN